MGADSGTSTEAIAPTSNLVMGLKIRGKPMEKIKGRWLNASTLESKEYTCFFCQRAIASYTGYICELEGGPYPSNANVYICYNCQNPTYFNVNKQYPAPAFGNPVEHLTKDISRLYEEARNCVGVNAFTASAMACRKILMHIAVDKSDKEGKSFKEYVDYLSGKYISSENKAWVDLIRNKGNEANHEIPLTSKEDAEQLIDFTEMLLKLIYEYPGKIPSKTPQTKKA